MSKRKDGDIQLSTRKQLKYNKQSSENIICNTKKTKNKHYWVQKLTSTITLFCLYSNVIIFY